MIEIESHSNSESYEDVELETKIIEEVEYVPSPQPLKRYLKRIYCPCTLQLQPKELGKRRDGKRNVYVAGNIEVNKSLLDKFESQYKLYKELWKQNSVKVRRDEMTPCELYDKIITENDLNLLGLACDLEYAPENVKAIRVEEERIDEKVKKNEVVPDGKLTRSVKRSGVTRESREIPFYKGLDVELDPLQGSTFAIIGSSKRGKTNLFKYLVAKYYSGKDWISTLYTSNPQVINTKANKKLKRLIVHGGWKKEEEKVIISQKVLNTECKNEDGNPKYQFFNAFDDIINVADSPIFSDMILTYRNARMTTCVLIQYSNLLSKMTRGNYNFLFFFGLNTDESIEIVLKTFLGSLFKNEFGVSNLREQIILYKKLTENYKFIFLDQLKESITIHTVPIQK